MLSLIGAAAVVASLTSPPHPAPPVELIRSIGGHPSAGLLRDKAGNLYGTTKSGGAYNVGNVFKLAPDGTYTSVYDFNGSSDGAAPLSDLISDAIGNLYGTAQEAGSGNVGVVFKVAPDGTETVLHSFSGGADGSSPAAGVVMDAKGSLYGTTTYGGGCHGGYGPGCGIVFKITPDGVETVLHAFTDGSDGSSPSAGVILDKKGNLYGTTGQSDASYGTVFEIKASGEFNVLHTFTQYNDGANPTGRLVRDTDGNLYGTTEVGPNNGNNGCGTVFKLTPEGAETLLYTFNGFDGCSPSAGLIRDHSGNLYGTTVYGGTFSRGCGVVFKLSPDGQETTLHSFFPNFNIDGCEPLGELLRTKNGNLYGTTYSGGVGDLGTVFVVTP
jgi:uncharacterized repeat protein (TIGR03803 family)